MSTLLVVAAVAVGLFATGTVIKPEQPVAGAVLQGAGIGTLVGGAVGAAAGAGSGLATALGTTTVASTTTATAVIGGFTGAAATMAIKNPDFYRQRAMLER